MRLVTDGELYAIEAGWGPFKHYKVLSGSFWLRKESPYLSECFDEKENVIKHLERLKKHKNLKVVSQDKPDHEPYSASQKMLSLTFFLMIIVSLMFGAVCIITSCTVEFQNISTNGKAKDLVDDTQEINSHVNPEIEIPLPVM